MPTLILASTSPYRKTVLDKLGLPFTTEAPDVDETAQPGETAEALVGRLARAKAAAVATRHTHGLIIGSDQLASLDGRILGKPGTHDKAIEQLQLASGRCVTFHTGLCLHNAATGRVQIDVVPFKVHFRTLTQAQIETYLKREQPYNSAGSFKSEGLGIVLFERLEGEDPNTLIGLPLIRLVSMLEAEDFQVL